jgi:hypothetical protein
MRPGSSIAPTDDHAVRKEAPRHNGDRREHPSVATTSTAKLLSTIAAGDPPGIFTEWWPEIGSFAAHGDILPMNAYLKGQ